MEFQIKSSHSCITRNDESLASPLLPFYNGALEQLESANEFLYHKLPVLFG